jgi:pimeloyl-ACP methyl ester carboxylesterase
MLRIENACYTGSNQREALFDLNIPENFNGKLLIFVHGYKGFKDWGPWNLVDFECTEAGFGFAKFNLSHNGGTPIYAKDFPDLIAFSKNTYTKEVNDIIHFLNHLSTLNLPEHSLHLIGHSRGGGMSLIASSEDNRIASITTWAAISSIEKRMPTGDELLDWKTKGVRYELNSRTQQQMPISYALYEDFQYNKNRLNIQKACEKVQIPCLVVHGTLDKSVSIDDGRNLAEWLKTPLFEIPGANHTFGGVHPIESYKLPDDLQTVLNLTLSFVGNL